MKPAAGMFPYFCTVTRCRKVLLRTTKFRKWNIKSDALRLWSLSYTLYIVKCNCLKLLLLGCSCSSKNQALVKLSVNLNLCLIILLHRYCVWKQGLNLKLTGTLTKLQHPPNLIKRLMGKGCHHWDLPVCMSQGEFLICTDFCYSNLQQFKQPKSKRSWDSPTFGNLIWPTHLMHTYRLLHSSRITTRCGFAVSLTVFFWFFFKDLFSVHFFTER